MLRRRTALALTAWAAVGSSVIAACSDKKTDDNASSRAPSPVVIEAAAPASWQSAETTIMGHRLTVALSPLVRASDAAAVIAVGITRAEDDVSAEQAAGSDDDGAQGVSDNVVAVASYMATSSAADSGGASGVVLLDTADRRVWTAASALNGARMDLKPGQSVVAFVPFGPVDVETVTVMVPQTGFFEVAVVDRDAAEGVEVDLAALDAAVAGLSLDEEAREPVVAERFSQTGDSSTTSTSEESVTVTLSSDVAFDIGSAWLSPDGEVRIRQLADQLAQYPEGGTIDIVGHTDDIADEDSNQRLSEMRAASVRNRLAALTPLDAWQVSVAGKGETEPAVAGTDAQARAANRRVVVTIIPIAGTAQAQAGAEAGAAPDASAPADPSIPVATGAEGVVVPNPHDGGQSSVTITLPEAVRSGAFLLGRLTVTAGQAGSGDSTKIGAWLQYSGGGYSNPREEAASTIGNGRSSTGLALLSGPDLVYPADFADPRIGAHTPLTETMLGGDLEEGMSTTVCVVWPDTGQNSLTIDHTSDEGGFSFRLTDIPVLDA